jgi:hypothetical protein
LVIIKSNNNSLYWVCGAHVYSGHTDPEWVISDKEAEHLIDIWGSLAPSSRRVVRPNILGYKGCFISSSMKMKWVSFRGIINCYKNGKFVESRFDAERIFEKKILDTAPDGTVPKAMLIEEFE